MRRMLIKIINNIAEDCDKTKLNKLKKISTLLNNINLPRSLLRNNLKRLMINIFKKEKISLSLLNFYFKDYLSKRKMPNIQNILMMPSYGYHKKVINDFIQDEKLNNNIAKCLHLTYSYNLLELM